MLLKLRQMLKFLYFFLTSFGCFFFVRGQWEKGGCEWMQVLGVGVSAGRARSCKNERRQYSVYHGGAFLQNIFFLSLFLSFFVDWQQYKKAETK